MMIKSRKDFVIKNGVNLIVVKPVWKYPITRGTIVFHKGAYVDPEAGKGLSALFFDMLNERVKLLEKVEQYGARIRSSTSLTRSFVSFAFLNKNLRRSFSLLSRFVSSFEADENLFNITQKKRIDRISILEDDPEYLISRRLHKTVYRGSELSNPVAGLKEDIEHITLDDVENYFKNEFLTSYVDIVVVTSVEWKRILDAIIRVVESIHPERIKMPTNPGRYIPEKILLKKKKLGNVFVSYFVPTPGIGSKEYIPLKLLSYVVGEGSFNSRLMKRLREDLGLAYYVTSSVTRGFSVNGKRYCGYFEVMAETGKQTVDDLIRELEGVLDNVVKTGITRSEMELAKSYYIELEKRRGETYKDLLDMILLERVYNLRENYFLKIRKEIMQVDENDMKKAIANLRDKEFSRIILQEDDRE